MTTPEKCPGCGEIKPMDSSLMFRWDCGSYLHFGGLWESMACLKRQRDQLKAELERVHAEQLVRNQTTNASLMEAWAERDRLRAELDEQRQARAEWVERAEVALAELRKQNAELREELENTHSAYQAKLADVEGKLRQGEELLAQMLKKKEWLGKGCPECGSPEDPWFSRMEPMGYFCPDCGREAE